MAESMFPLRFHHELTYRQLFRKARGRLQRRAEVHCCKEDYGRGRGEHSYERCEQVARIYAQEHGHGESTIWEGKLDWLV